MTGDERAEGYGSASIDDLLRHDDDTPSRPRRRPSAVRAALTAGLAAAALTVVAVFLLLMAGVRVPPVLLFTGFLALIVLRRLVARVKAPPSPRARARARGVDGDGADGSDTWRAQDALGAAVRGWETRLEWSQTDAARFSRTVLPVLAELADERLRQRHGLTRASDPRRARELLGEPLWRVLGEPGRPPRPRELAVHVETLEKL